MLCTVKQCIITPVNKKKTSDRSDIKGDLRNEVSLHNQE
nr:MAG TPA: hypothetical protein [Caudoviricetes sp.]